MAKLKPCPFCGGEAHIHRRKSCKKYLWDIGCYGYCICWIPPKGLDKSENGFVDKKEAIYTWNKRHNG